MVKEEKNFNSIIQMIQMKPEIKELMEGKIREMNQDAKLVTEYRTWKDENEWINASIINEERKEARQEGLEEGINNRNKEIVLEMFNNKVSIELIGKYTNLSQEEIEKILKNN